MKYMLLIYMGEKVITQTEREACCLESTQVCHDLAAKGEFIDARPLQPISTATSIRVREGKKFVTDGPFAETREQLGGFFMIDVKDLDAAIAVATKIPGARYGTIEIRPVVELPNMPQA